MKLTKFNCKPIFIAFLLFFSTLNLKSQDIKILRSTIGSSGVSIMQTDGPQQYFVAQTVGQTGITGTVNSKGIILSQGFIQPIMGLNSHIKNTEQLSASFYPNPVKDILNISIDEYTEKEVYILISDFAGKVVFDSKFQNKAEIRLNLYYLTEGGYVLNIKSGKKVYSSNFFKQ